MNKQQLDDCKSLVEALMDKTVAASKADLRGALKDLAAEPAS